MPSYLIVQEFLRIEAIGTVGKGNGTPADPIRINAYVCPSDELDTNVESRDTDKPEDSNDLFKVSLGNWALRLNPGRYLPKKAYTATFRYWSTPNNVNVVRQNFVWDPIPDSPRVPGNCIVFGVLKDVSGLPVSGERLVVERYKNIVTLNNREMQSTVQTNSFGFWSIELPIGSIVRFVFGNISKAITVPDRMTVALNDVPDHQPESALHDAFGYPFPREGA